MGCHLLGLPLRCCVAKGLVWATDVGGQLHLEPDQCLSMWLLESLGVEFVLV